MIQRTRSLFLRALGVTFAIAFGSLAVQISGLLGADGLEPVASFLGAASRALGGAAPLRVPTIFWLSAGDGALLGACLAGVGAGSLLALGIAPFPSSLACWLLYLSLVSVGQDFLRYQWDALLLETGFLAVLWAPLSLRLRARGAPEPSRAVLWLLRWLLFRLMFFSGFVKLASGDRTWWDLTALAHHYETQPLPTWTSWYAHQLPLWFQKLSCAAMFGIELLLPFLVFLGRRPRAIACAGLLFLQGLIAATGNYGFFNLLAAILCIPLLDDAQLEAIRARLRRRRPARDRAGVTGARSAEGKRASAAAWRWMTPRPILALGVLISSAPVVASQLFGRWPALPAPLVALHQAIEPFYLVGRYGLFAVMTTTRPEIVIEGSADGETWTPYVFRWKPGPLDRAPSFVEPHMPRLDWQLWFDALYVERALDTGRAGRDLVTPRLVERLLEGSAPVRALLLDGPSADAPPRYVRWRLYHYRFTDADERAQTGAWWKDRLLYESRTFSSRD